MTVLAVDARNAVFQEGSVSPVTTEAGGGPRPGHRQSCHCEGLMESRRRSVRYEDEMSER